MKLVQLLLCRRKAGGKLQRFFKVRARLPAAAAADEGEPEIEEIAMVRPVARNRGAEGLFRFVQMSVAAQRHAERVPGRCTGRVDGNRRTKAGERRVDMHEIAQDFAQSLPDHGVFGEKRERGFEGRHRFIGAPQPKAQVCVEDRERRAVRIVFPALTNDRECGLGSIRRQTRFAPTGPCLFEHRRPSRGLLEMRGGAIGAFQTQGFSEPNPDAIDEVEVLSLGAPAEYGNLTGAVYNIVTKQGTNQFHGDAGYFFQSNGLTSNNTNDVKFPNGKFADACADNPDASCPWTRGDYFEA